MRRLHTIVGAGVLLLAVTACAEQQPGVGFGGQPQPAPAAPVQPKPEHERTTVPESAVDKSRLRQGYTHPVWTQDGGKTVVAIGQEGGCSRVQAEVADQNAQQVIVRLVEKTPDPPKICTMDLRYPPVAVQLDAPLDQRKVVLERTEVKVPSK